MPTPAENYEAFMVPPLFAPWADALAARARPAPGAAILDVGCGTGIVARRLAPRTAPAASSASTPTPAMLDVARAAAAREGRAIEWRQGAAERLPVRRRRVRPRHLPVRADVLRRPRRGARRDAPGAAPRRPARLSVLQPIGRHPFYVDARPGDPGPARRLRRRARSSPSATPPRSGRRSKPPASATSRSRRPPWTPASPTPAGFLAGEIEVDTAAIPSMQALGPDARRELVAALEREMSGPLAAVTRGGEVVMPFHVLIADRPPDLKAASLLPQRPRQQRLHRARERRRPVQHVGHRRGDRQLDPVRRARAAQAARAVATPSTVPAGAAPRRRRGRGRARSCATAPSCR